MLLFEAEHIAASFSLDGDEPLFAGVDLALEAGKIYDLVGASGSGKSMLLRVLARMFDPVAGSLYLEERPSAEFTPTQWRKRVCLVPQASALVPGTIRDNLVLPWKLKVRQKEEAPDDQMLEQMLERAQLSDIELDRDASQLSGGQAARIALLRAFVTKPQVLLLDEVDAALDDDSSQAIGLLTRDFVDEQTTCLRIRHRPSDGLASQTFLLKDRTLSAKQDREVGDH